MNKIIFVLSFFFIFSSCSKVIVNKINIDINSARTNSNSSKLTISFTVKNEGDKSYFIFPATRICTNDNQEDYFWVAYVQFNDSIRLHNGCGLLNMGLPAKRTYIQLKRNSVTSFVGDIDLNNIVAFEDIKKIPNLSNPYLSNYSIFLKYIDRAKFNNRDKPEVFISNKVYFTYQKQ